MACHSVMEAQFKVIVVVFYGLENRGSRNRSSYKRFQIYPLEPPLFGAEGKPPNLVKSSLRYSKSICQSTFGNCQRFES